MGQRVVQVLWGINTSTKECPDLLNEEGDWLWDNYSIPQTDRLPYREAPRIDENGDVIGFRVAAGPGCDDEEGFLGEPCALENFATHHAGHLSAAQAKWTTFAIWMQTRCAVRLPAPRLFICTGERA